MMSDPLTPGGDGHTELSDEDREGLIPTYIATRGELFEAEQRNIVQALSSRVAPSVDEVLDDLYLRRLHRAMFGQVWRWAGQYRTTETNIGVDPTRVAVAVRVLGDDARAWSQSSTFEPDELAVRFHHRLVAIHPFANGNGRHSRIAADLLVAAMGRERFTWGAHLQVDTTELRGRYLRALRRADNLEIDDLLAFARA